MVPKILDTDIVVDKTGSQFTVFVIDLDLGNDKKIRRRFRQFSKLNEELALQFPTKYNATRFPPEKWINQTDPAFIQQRRLALAAWVDYIFKNDEIRDSRDVQAFFFDTNSPVNDLKMLSCAMHKHPEPKDWKVLDEEVAQMIEKPNSDLLAQTTRPDELNRGVVLAATRMVGDSDEVEEMARGIVSVSFKQFCKKLPPSRWGVSLFGYIGGDVEVLAQDEENRPVKQIERMVLQTTMSKSLGSFGKKLVSAAKDLDMTKCEHIKYESSAVTVYWNAYASDNDTVVKDWGYVKFSEGEQDDETLVEFNSVHGFSPSFLSAVSFFRSGMHAILQRQVKNQFIDHILGFKNKV